MPRAKKQRKLRPYEKVGVFLIHYEKKCILYDVDQLQPVKDVYEPILVKKGKKLPQLFQLAELEIPATQLRPLIDSWQETEIRIRFLSILNTASGDDGAHAITKALVPPLEIAGLAYHANGCSESGARAIARCFRGSKFLAILELDFNPLGDAGCVGLSHYGHCPTLTKVSLRCCDIGDGGAAALGKWIASEECKIKELFLNGNRIGPPGAIALAGGLSANKSIVRLDLADNLFGYDGAALEAFYDAIHECPTIQAFNALSHFEMPEGMGQKFLELTTEKPLGECVLSVKMDTFTFQNMRSIALANKKKLARQAKAERKAALKAAKEAAKAEKEAAARAKAAKEAPPVVPSAPEGEKPATPVA